MKLSCSGDVAIHSIVRPKKYGWRFVVFVLFCFVLFLLSTGWFYPYPSRLLHWHWGNLMIAPVPVKQPWRIWINATQESNMNNKTKSKSYWVLAVRHCQGRCLCLGLTYGLATVPMVRVVIPRSLWRRQPWQHRPATRGAVNTHHQEITALN